MVQGWLELRRSQGKATRVYGVLKQRTLLVGPTALLDRSQPETEEFFLEGASAAVARNNAATGEFEMQVTLGSGEQLASGKILARISSRPGQSGRADGYILEDEELSFYHKKINQKKK